VEATLVVAHGGTFYLVDPEGRARAFAPLPADEGPSAGRLSESIVEELRRRGSERPVVAGGPALAAELARRLGRPTRAATPEEWHRALVALPAPEAAAERVRVLARARSDLDAALRSPVEVLVSLAREEERLERALGRERRAAEAFVALRGTVLAEHAADWTRSRDLMAGHHALLLRRLEAEVRSTAPNLSAVLGPRTAARLVAAAGGLAPLARIAASRLQLLGARRRPDPEHGPRFGVLYLAEGADSVPADRRGAYARSLAALAAIAARADALTGADLTGVLVRRREARRQQLRRRGGG